MIMADSLASSLAILTVGALLLVVGSPRTRAGEMLALDLTTGAERALRLADVLERPAQYFREAAGGGSHA